MLCEDARLAVRHFTQLLVGKLPRGLHCSGYVSFWLRDQITKFIIHKKNLAFWPKSPKFNARQIFLQHGMEGEGLRDLVTCGDVR